MTNFEKECAARAEAAALALAELTARLNAAAEKAGEPAGYVLERHLHQDNYRDRWGYKVAAGPNEERALKWVAAATKGRVTSSNVPWSGTDDEGKYKTDWVKTNYVETGSYYIGD